MAIIKKFRIKSFKQQKPLVSLKKISLSFGKRQILDDISFNINPGEILGMLGPNGVGKSTIFHLITGLIKPDYGSLIFNNINEATVLIKKILNDKNYSTSLCNELNNKFNKSEILIEKSLDKIFNRIKSK